MSSETFELQLSRIHDYLDVFVVAAVVYDYLLTFFRELEYVWCRPWTFLSTMFVLVRYVGVTWAIISSLGTIIDLMNVWGYLIFLFAADLIMILRVYAIWDRSKMILYILLFIYVSQVIANLVSMGIYNNLNTYYSITVEHVINVSFCNETFVNTPTLLVLYGLGPRFLLSATLIVLAVVPTIRQSISMYKATKQWQPNQFVQLLIGHGILYFLANIIINVVYLMQVVQPDTNSSVRMHILGSLGEMAFCNMMPRFLISVREVYERELCHRYQGIDTGFGIISQPFANQGTAIYEDAFMEVASGQGQAVEGGDADGSRSIRPEVLEDNAYQV